MNLQEAADAPSNEAFGKFLSLPGSVTDSVVRSTLKSWILNPKFSEKLRKMGTEFLLQLVFMGGYQAIGNWFGKSGLFRSESRKDGQGSRFIKIYSTDKPINLFGYHVGKSQQSLQAISFTSLSVNNLGYLRVN